MKSLTILLLLAVTLTVTVDAGRNRKHRSDVREEEVDNNENVPDFPSLEQILHFEVPEEIMHPGSHDDGTDENDQNSGHDHKKSSTHGRSHSHG